MLRSLRKFFRRDDGLAGLEFSLIAPVMIVAFVGTIETTNFLSAHRKVSTVASTMSDLVGRTVAVDDNFIGIVQGAVESIMQPYDGTSVEVVISSVVAEDDSGTTKYFVHWSDAKLSGAAAHTRCTEYPLTDKAKAMIALNESLVVTEVSFNHTLVLGDFKMGFVGGDAYEQKQSDSVWQVEEVFHLKPRRTTSVDRCPTLSPTGKCDAATRINDPCA